MCFIINSHDCAPPAIELIHIVEKHDTLITINFWADELVW